MKLPGSTKSKITKNKHCESVPNLEITEVDSEFSYSETRMRQPLLGPF